MAWCCWWVDISATVCRNQLGFQLNVFAWLVGMPAEWLARLVLTVAGHL